MQEQVVRHFNISCLIVVDLSPGDEVALTITFASIFFLNFWFKYDLLLRIRDWFAPILLQ